MVVIHQLLGGDKGSDGYDLLATTLPDRILAKKLNRRTDLHMRLPQDVAWLPILRGILVDDYYLLMKTYPDDITRNGRVFSHTLVIAKEDLVKIDDITPLLNLFEPTINKNIVIKSILLENKVINVESIKNDLIRSGLIGILKNSQFKQTIVWGDYEGFDDFIKNIWQRLKIMPQLRENLHFGLFNSPTEIETISNRLNIIYTPQKLQNKWRNNLFYTVENEITKPMPQLERLFLGTNEDLDKLGKYILTFDYAVKSLADLDKLSKLMFHCDNLDKSDQAFVDVRTLMELLSKYCPNEEHAEYLKEKSLSKFIDGIKYAKPAEIWLLGNNDFKGFKDGISKIENGIKEWLEEKLLIEDSVEIGNLIEKNLESQTWFKSILTESLRKHFGMWKSECCQAIWSWIIEKPTLLNSLETFIPVADSIQQSFIDSLSNDFKSDFIEHLELFIKKRRWFQLHASVVLKKYSLNEALQAILAVDSQNTEGVNFLSKSIASSKFINLTLNNEDDRLYSKSAELLYHDKSLWATFKVSSNSWLKLWLFTIEYTHGILKSTEYKYKTIEDNDYIFNGIESKETTTYNLLDLLIERHQVEPKLLNYIASSSLGDILNYPKRSQIWTFLPYPVKNIFLEKTATGYYKSLISSSVDSIEIESELETLVTSDKMLPDFLYLNRDNIRYVLIMFNQFPKLPERFLIDYINHYPNELSISQSSSLGQLINKRNWYSLANKTYEKSTYNDSFKRVLIECKSFLSLRNRIKAFLFWGEDFSTFSADDWWTELRELVPNLYEDGLKDREIWDRADGKKSEISLSGSGKEQWHSAFSFLKRGGGKDITIKKLLKEMRKDYPQNNELETLSKLIDKI